MTVIRSRRGLHALTAGLLLVSTAAPAAAAPNMHTAADCAKYVNSAEREPSWYDATCRPAGAKAAAVAAAKVNFDAQPAAPTAPGDPAYQLDLRATPNTFETFALPNAAAPSTTPTTTFDSFALEHDNATGVLWGIENVTFALGTVNKATGAFTAGPTVTGLAAAENVTGLAFVNSNSTFYVSAGNGTVSNIYSLNKTTGALTLIGPTGTALMIDIAINNAGQLYGHDIATDSLYTINTTTGAATLIGPTGVAANFAQSIDFDKSTGVLYGWIYEGTGVNRFASFNLTTGAATTLATPTNKEYEGALTPVSLQSFSVD